MGHVQARQPSHRRFILMHGLDPTLLQCRHPLCAIAPFRAVKAAVVPPMLRGLLPAIILAVAAAGLLGRNCISEEAPAASAVQTPQGIAAARAVRRAVAWLSA